MWVEQLFSWITVVLINDAMLNCSCCSSGFTVVLVTMEPVVLLVKICFHLFGAACFVIQFIILYFISQAADCVSVCVICAVYFVCVSVWCSIMWINVYAYLWMHSMYQSVYLSGARLRVVHLRMHGSAQFHTHLSLRTSTNWLVAHFAGAIWVIQSSFIKF